MMFTVVAIQLWLCDIWAVLLPADGVLGRSPMRGVQLYTCARLGPAALPAGKTPRPN
jgi:hypothetical protein